ncbi:AAA family ATPase [Celerinatantimonas sp. YJH-8]|uniref:McrB family protein n=1 Tax=Celerinatantimonas sp. YJH-8 TaxID=3228714 RepID=UPI0038C40BAE
MADDQRTYSPAVLKDHSDEALIELLKELWGYEVSQPFMILGQLSERQGANSNSFYVLENLRSAVDDHPLLYPISMPKYMHTVFIGSLKGKLFTDRDSIDGRWVNVLAELSPREERQKHNNPFALKAINDSVQWLSILPDNIKETTYTIDGAQYLDKRVFDAVINKNHQLITKDHQRLSSALEQQRLAESERLSTLQENIAVLNQQVNTQQDNLETAKADLSATLAHQQQAMEQFTQQKTVMERQLNKLNQFLEQKAKMLVDLNIIDQSDMDILLGHSTQQTEVVGHDFVDVFEGDVTRAVSYIQAFMQHHHSIYRRQVLEDFFALVTTHDLIVLAGDSGSGKTNLVKSFAKAIGGKAVVVPVKPNWTSAEDLLGYYNPLERKYLSTPFLDALFEAQQNPDVPYFICLDEMNLARIEYYFADFLSLLEERDVTPEIPLYSDAEAEHLLNEVRNFLALIDVAKDKLDKPDLLTFLDLLRDEALNAKLQELCGFGEGESLLTYHSQLRKLVSSYLKTPSSLTLPANVRIIGAINVDETTHYLSPKILDRVHIMRFSSPLLFDWADVEAEVETFDLDLALPLHIDIEALGKRTPYPEYDRTDPLVMMLVQLARDYLVPLGVEFGLRTVRQALLYQDSMRRFGSDDVLILNNIVLHKVLPKLLFDGEKPINDTLTRKDVLTNMRDFLSTQLAQLDVDGTASAVEELDRVIANAQANDWVVNYWAR